MYNPRKKKTIDSTYEYVFAWWCLSPAGTGCKTTCQSPADTSQTHTRSTARALLPHSTLSRRDNQQGYYSQKIHRTLIRADRAVATQFPPGSRSPGDTTRTPFGQHLLASCPRGRGCRSLGHSFPVYFRAGTQCTLRRPPLLLPE